MADLPSKMVTSLDAHQGPVLTVRLNGDGTYCLSGGQDKCLRLWNPHRGALVKTYKGHGYEILDIAVSKDNSKLVSCGGDKLVFCWDVATGRIIRKFRGHNHRVNSCALNDDDTVLVAASYDQTARIWDCRAKSQDAMQVLDQFKDSVTCVKIVGCDIITSCVDGSVRRFDVRMGRILTDNLDQPVTWLGLSNDGNCVLASCLDSTLRLLDKDAGELLIEYRGHVNKSYKLEALLTNTDEYVISGSEDKAMYCWSLVDGTMVKKLEGHAGTVCTLAYHPAEVCLLSGSTDGTIKVWR